MDAPRRVGDKLARVLGAGPGEVAVSDATSVNLFKLAVAALRARPGRKTIVTDALNFPSDRYVLGGAADLLGAGRRVVVVPSRDGIAIEDADLDAAITEDTALVSLSHVAYRSGFLHDMAAVTARAHAAGRARSLGREPFRGSRPDRPRGFRRRPRGGLHVQVPERRAGISCVPLRAALSPAGARKPDSRLVLAARALLVSRELRAGARPVAVSRGHAADPLPGGGGGGGGPRARGGDRSARGRSRSRWESSSCVSGRRFSSRAA